jgi:hypothetical protein
LQLAFESGLKPAWLSQVLSGRRRKAVNHVLMRKLHGGLKKVFYSSKGIHDVERFAAELDLKFAPFIVEARSLAETSSSSLRVAGDLLEKLVESCPTKEQRIQVIKFLKLIVEAE